LGDFATRFQQSGFTVLVYDPRGWGESGGAPRNEVDPQKQIQDYYDAFDFVAGLPDVDPGKVVYWGSSMSGGVVLQAAAFDPRISGVIVQAPFVSADAQVGPVASAMADTLFKERAAVRGGSGRQMLPVFPETIEEARSGTSHAILNQPEAFIFIDECNRQGKHLERYVTATTLLNVMTFEPRSFIRKISPKPILMVVAENDRTTSVESQLEAYQFAHEPKKLKIVRNAGHFEIYFGEKFEENIEAQLAFLDDLFL
jgi:fermentation-respiration switch protein FrsA (DUF1100 family)